MLLEWFPTITYAQYSSDPAGAAKLLTAGTRYGMYYPGIGLSGSHQLTNPAIGTPTGGAPDGYLKWRVPSLVSGSGWLEFFTSDSDGGGSQYPITGCANFVITAPSPYSEWASYFFGSMAPVSQTGATATPANDGITNLMKYALGLNPNVAYSPKSSGMPAMGIATSGSNNYLNLTFTGTATDVSYSVQVTNDLKTWSPLQTWAAGSAPGTVMVSDTIPISSASKRFMRLMVSL